MVEVVVIAARIRRLSLGALLSVAALPACYRYVTTTRPLTAADCPREPPSHTFARFQPDASGGPGVIRGTVVDADVPDSSSRRPVGGAVVSVEGTKQGARSDDAGRFTIAGVAPGRYALVTRRVGFEVRRDSVVVGTTGIVFDVGLKVAMLDGCPGFMVMATRKRVWRWPWQ